MKVMTLIANFINKSRSNENKLYELERKLKNANNRIRELEAEKNVYEPTDTVNRFLTTILKIPDSLDKDIEIIDNDYINKLPIVNSLLKRDKEFYDAVNIIGNSIKKSEYTKVGELKLNAGLEKIIAGYRNYYFFIQAAKKPFGELVTAIKQNGESVDFSREYETQVLKNIFELAILAKDESTKTNLKKALEFSEIAVFRANSNIKFMNYIKSGDNDALEVISDLNKGTDSQYFKIAEFITSSSKIDLFPLNLVVIGKKLGIKRLDTLIDGVYVPKPLNEYNFD